MPLELFVPKAFNANTRRVIRQANSILNEYRERGFVLTLRQLYYQFVGRGFIANKQTEYKRLGSIISDARLAGQIDWNMIEDRTRGLSATPSWESPADIIEAISHGYKTDIWENQEYRPEVWIEKEALVGVIEPVCREFRIPYFACRGYTSQSEQWRAGHRLRGHLRAGQRVVVLHLGDHDPSGIDMTRDNDDRLALFARTMQIELRRIALNMNQVEDLSLPPNPAKLTDSRFAGYADKFGEESWELDALDPTYIDELIRGEIEPLRDLDAWNATLTEEDEAKRIMAAAAARWSDISEMIDRPDYA